MPRSKHASNSMNSKAGNRIILMDAYHLVANAQSDRLKELVIPFVFKGRATRGTDTMCHRGGSLLIS